MRKFHFLLLAMASLTALSACQQSEQGEPAKAEAEASQNNPAQTNAPQTDAPQTNAPSGPKTKLPPSPTMTRWHYDEQRRAAIYDTAAGEPLFWVACKGSPAGRSLYIMAAGKKAPAGEATLHLGLRSSEVTMPVTSVKAAGDGLSWSGEVPLTGDVAQFLDSIDPRAQFRLTIDDKDTRMVPNDPAIKQAIAACRA